ncbi:MAG TPA: hypothetical protein VFR17_10785 [Mycobacterium sp.]|nr:hypothetical protein [Mycobacterium sp.]
MGNQSGAGAKRSALPAATAVVTAATAVGVLLGAGHAHADPLVPGPDYCGNALDVFFCTYHRSTYPNAGESGFLDATRGSVPGTDASHLAAGRAACLELMSDSPGRAVGDVGNYLKIAPPMANRVVDDAHSNICPWVKR